MRHFIAIFTVVLLSIFPAYAQSESAKINKVWLERNLTVNNRQAMRVHCDFTIYNMPGETGFMGIWIKAPNGEWLNINSASKLSSGTKYFKKEFTPKYNTSHYSDCKKTIYLDDLNLLNGKNKYKIVVTIHNSKGTNIAQSDYIDFSATGASNNNKLNKKNNNHNRKHNSNVKTWREELGYGGFVIVNEYPNGSQQRIRYRQCPNCYGSTECKMCLGQKSQCPFCHGYGYIVSAGYGTHIPCYNCQTNTPGACAICGGTGKCKACENSGYPGYVIAATTYLDAQGNVTSKDKAEYNGYDNNSKKNNKNKGKLTCPDCGGTRLYHGGNSPEYAEPNRELVGYYHPSGSKCPHCGTYNQHWHSKCPTCKHYPGTKNPYR